MAWIALVVIGVIGQILMIIYFHVWQDEVRDLNGVPRMGFWDHPLTAVLSIVVLFVFVEIGQLVGRLVRFLERQLSRFAPPRVSAVVVVVLLLALTIALLNGIVVRFAMSTLNSTFDAVNDETDPEFAAPTSPLRSGGPQSLVTWESLGHQGRVFVSAGPTVDELTKFNGKPGHRADPRLCRTAFRRRHQGDGRLAADELERKGGLDRAVIAVATTTGTGWINEAEASSLEYMYNGDTAIVSDAVLVPAELVVVPGGQGERASIRAGAVRGGRCQDPRQVRRCAGRAMAASWWCSARASARSAVRRRSWR